MKHQLLHIIAIGMLAWNTCASAGDLPAGRYVITAAHSGKCVEVAGAGLHDGANIQQYSCNNSAAQAFDVFAELAQLSGRVDATHQRAAGRAGDGHDIQSACAQGLDDPDLRQPACAAGAERQRYFFTLAYGGRGRGHQRP